MSNAATKSDTSVKVINTAQKEEILALYRTLHTKVLSALQGCDIKPLFNDNFAKCGNEDYKLLHQQSRALVIAHEKSEWESYIGSIRSKVNGVIDTYMTRARAAKAQFDALKLSMGEAGALLPAFSSTVKVPVSDLVGCWPTNTDDSRVLVELDKLFPRNVGKGKDDKFFLTVAYKEEEVVEAAPVSDTQTKAA